MNLDQLDQKIEEIKKLIVKEIDDSFYAGVECGGVEYGTDGWIAELSEELEEKIDAIKSLIKEVCEEVIGKKQRIYDRDDFLDGREKSYFNDLRSSQRERLNKIIGE